MIPAPFSGLINFRNETITLAVVLRAINNGPLEKRVAIENDGSFVTYGMEIIEGKGTIVTEMGPTWNLEHDNYDQQSEECKQFIGSILGV